MRSMLKLLFVGTRRLASLGCYSLAPVQDGLSGQETCCGTDVLESGGVAQVKCSFCSLRPEVYVLCLYVLGIMSTSWSTHCACISRLSEVACSSLTLTCIHEEGLRMLM